MALRARGDGAKAVRQPRLTGVQRQKTIVDAAAQVFARRGYEGARLEEIAGIAGVSKALIYEHFDGKRELYAHISRSGSGESLGRVLVAAASETESVERLRSALGAFLDFVAEQPAVWRVHQQEVSDPEIIAQHTSQQERSVKAIAQLLAADEEMARLDLTPAQQELFAVAINGAAIRVSLWWLDNPSIDRDEVLDGLMEFMWLGIERIRSGETYGDLKRRADPAPSQASGNGSGDPSPDRLGEPSRPLD